MPGPVRILYLQSSPVRMVRSEKYPQPKIYATSIVSTAWLASNTSSLSSIIDYKRCLNQPQVV